MKFLALVIATAGYAVAAEFVTGQAARLVIGQDTFTRQSTSVSEAILGAVSGVAYGNDTLLIVDGNRIQANPQNNRVLVYRNISSKVPSAKAEIRSSMRCPVCGGTADIVLGQSDFTKNEIGLGQAKLRTPTSVATDGRVIAVADTDNNRVLIWNRIPDASGANADVVVGQSDFTKNQTNFGGSGNTPSSKGLRGPQGVWIQDGKLYVADTQNHRVLIWNSVPTQNGQEANVVLGKPDFQTFVQSELTAAVDASASTLLNPVSVTSDGTRLLVADLGHNRVLVWNRIPTGNSTPADFALGQPDVNSSKDSLATTANNASRLCKATGAKDTAGKDVYPARCAATLDFPRFALSDGTRFFVADGGNDRILIWNRIPTQNGQAADVVLGQLTDQLAQASGDRISAADNVRTPMSLAWDGTNLYVGDPFNRRVLVFTPGDQALPVTGVRNAASQEIFALGNLTFAAEPKEND
ncbi:MAG: hypothetical protein WKF37_07575 [Bryobacteraceae bacterium]